MLIIIQYRYLGITDFGQHQKGVITVVFYHHIGNQVGWNDEVVMIGHNHLSNWSINHSSNSLNLSSVQIADEADQFDLIFDRKNQRSFVLAELQ